MMIPTSQENVSDTELLCVADTLLSFGTETHSTRTPFKLPSLSQFRVLSSQIAVTSLTMMSGPQFTRPQSTGLPNLWGNASLITSCNRS